jgi:SAM-dependent methyltransferase
VSLEVLQGQGQIQQARARLQERNISCLDLEVGRRSPWQRLRGMAPVSLGDPVKSWDVLRTAEFLEGRLPGTARVLDIGAYNSEILCVLHRLGFSRLTGLDLNPGIREMPYREHIRYEIGNFLQAPFPDRSFDAITAISVIEHGFEAPALLRELSRLLVSGGCFVASVDYWPEKIDTAGTRFFGRDWCIFSSQEVEAFLSQAAGYGFSPVGALHLGVGERAIHCAGRDYTFAWMALQQR